MSFMSWLTGAKQGLADGVKRFNNRTFLDATVAGCALVAAADGSIDSDEKQKMVGFLKINEALQVFDLKTAVDRFNEFAGQLEFDHGIGKDECLKAIAKCSSNEEQSRMLVRVCCAIGAADGDFDDDEKEVVREICKKLNLRSSDFSL